MDGSPPKQQPPNDISSGYGSLSGSPHSDLTTMTTHDMTLYPTKNDLSNATNGAGPMRMSMADMSNPAKITSMEFLESATPVRASAPSFIPDFPGTNGFAPRPHIDSRGTLHSSPSGTSTVSSNPSHATSPAMHSGLPTTYSGTTSSLASALDSLGVTRSRSGSSASPNNFMGTDFKFSPVNGSQIHAAHEFLFPPSDLVDLSTKHKRDSPDAPADSHLMAIGDMLTNISKTAHSAKEACSVGNSATAGVKVDELKRTIALVSQLLEATQLADSPNTSPNYSGVSSNASHSPPHMGSIGQDHQSMLPPYTAHDPSAMDVQGTLDLGDGSRKRCASSMAGDRALKTMKLEPQDDAPLHITPTTANPLHIHSPTYPTMPPFLPSDPPSAPPSRPSSTTGLRTHHSFNPVQQQQQYSFNFPEMDLTSPTTLQQTDFTALTRGSSSTTPTHTVGPPLPSPSLTRMPWSDGPATFPSRQHQHSASGSSLSGNGVNLPGLGPSSASIPPFTAPGAFGAAPPPPLSQQRPGTNMNGVPISPTTSRPVGRLSRSGSMTGNAGNPFAFGLPEVVPQDNYGISYNRPSTAISAPQSPASSPEEEYDWEGFESDMGGDQSQSHSPSASGMRGRSNGDGTGSGGRPSTGHHNHALPSQSSGDNAGGTSSSHGNEVPQEYRSEVDRVFFEFLSSTCSNLDATDSKGEPIHQTLMAKKMQRLDESPEFRPFKFRIQAFTNAFLEELARQGYPEEKIPMKKIRNYLWNQTYISRFNEDGKKAKSKGNHIWNINAKKKPEGGWVFSPFHRRLAGTPHGVAYVGLRWNWAPRIWDPQASRSNVPVVYASPNLPPWLTWKDDQLSGIPPPDAESCDITVEAKFTQDGQEELLSQTVHLNIAPMSTLDSSFSTSRRPSLAGDISNPRRGQSDSVVPQLAPPRNLMRTQTSVAPTPSGSSSQDTQVLQVLTTAAQRVAQEAQSQVISSRTPSEPTPALELLAKQQHVLTVTAQALDQTLDHTGTGSRVDVGSQPSHVLAMASAAQQVVLQAARTVTADRTALNSSMGIQTPQSTVASQVTVNEVSVATQTAVAQAVGMSGPLSSEVDVLMTASSLLQQQARNTPPAPSPPATLDPSQLSAPLEQVRPHSTGNLPSRQTFPMNTTAGSPTLSSFVPTSLSNVPVPEYVQL